MKHFAPNNTKMLKPDQVTKRRAKSNSNSKNKNKSKS
jgi:hypothetical protein